MNVLFVTYDFPYPMTSGGKNRAFHLLKYTASKANVFLYSFVRDDYNPDSNTEILNLGVKKIKVFKRKKLASLSNIPDILLHDFSIFKSLYYEKTVADDLREIIRNEKIDIVHYESSYTGFYIDQLKSLRVKQVLGTENIEFKLYEDYAKSMRMFSPKPFVKFQAKRFKNEELSMVKNADVVTVITKDEVNILNDLTGVKSSIVANGIEPEAFSYVFEKKLKNNMLFVGNFSYFPNIDAVNFFYEKVFKKLSQDVTITIVGKKCKEKFKFEDRRIIKKDFVPDIISEYRNADVLLFPIRIGGGTNFKVLEAMSLGIPIVANPDRLSGLDAKDGTHFLSARTGEEYAQKIAMLYEDVQLRAQIALQARKLIESKFDWKNIGQDLLTIWKGLI